MDYQLLVAWPVVELLESLPRRERRHLRECLVSIHRDPRGTSDYQEPDAVGRPVEIHVCSGYAFKYWIDHGFERPAHDILSLIYRRLCQMTD